MRRLSSIGVIAAAVLFAACSSSSATTAPVASEAASQAASQPAESASAAPSAAPSEAASASAAAESPAASVDISAFGSKYAEIQSKLQAATAAIMAKLATAKSPADIGAVYKEWSAAVKSAIAEYKAVDWPSVAKDDILQALDKEDQLVGLLGDIGSDPAAMAANQSKIQQLTTELQALGKKIAADLGQPVP
jgi:hypothetical protein